MPKGVKYLIFGTLLTAIICCSKKPLSQTFKVNLADTLSVPIGNWFSAIEIIPLETNEHSLLNECSKIEYFHDRYYIFDRRQQAVFVFDSLGKFLFNTTSSKGKGPGEYNMIADIAVNRSTGNLEILDAPARRILLFTKDGSFIKNLILPKDLLPLGQFRSLSDELYLFYVGDRSNSRTCIHVYAVKGQKVIKKMLMMNNYENYFIRTHDDPFYWADSAMWFSHTFPNNDIYQIDVHLGITKLYSYNFGDKTFNTNILPKKETPAFYGSFNLNNKNRYAFPFAKFENNNYNFCFFAYNDAMYISRHHKRQQGADSTHEVISAKFKDGGMVLPPALFDNTCLYNIIEPSWFPYIMSPLFTDRQKELLNTISESDNPVIFKYKFR